SRHAARRERHDPVHRRGRRAAAQGNDSCVPERHPRRGGPASGGPGVPGEHPAVPVHGWQDAPGKQKEDGVTAMRHHPQLLRTLLGAALALAVGCGTLAGNPEDDDDDKEKKVVTTPPGETPGSKAPVSFAITDAPLEEVDK